MGLPIQIYLKGKKRRTREDQLESIPENSLQIRQREAARLKREGANQQASIPAEDEDDFDEEFDEDFDDDFDADKDHFKDEDLDDSYFT
jgi:hypothetical protein